MKKEEILEPMQAASSLLNVKSYIVISDDKKFKSKHYTDVDSCIEEFRLFLGMDYDSFFKYLNQEHAIEMIQYYEYESIKKSMYCYYPAKTIDGIEYWGKEFYKTKTRNAMTGKWYHYEKSGWKNIKHSEKIKSELHHKWVSDVLDYQMRGIVAEWKD